jgi:hypothetical protein
MLGIDFAGIESDDQTLAGGGHVIQLDVHGGNFGKDSC